MEISKQSKSMIHMKYEEFKAIYDEIHKYGTFCSDEGNLTIALGIYPKRGNDIKTADLIHDIKK